MIIIVLTVMIALSPAINGNDPRFAASSPTVTASHGRETDHGPP